MEDRKQKRLWIEKVKRDNAKVARCKVCGKRIRGANHEKGDAHIAKISVR